MNNIKHIGLAAIFFFTACDGTREKSSEDNLQIAQCLMAKDYKYEDMLTKEDIAKHVPIDKQSFKVEVSPVKGAYGSCSYEWDSDRPDTQIELLGQLIPVPDKNRVTIKMLNFYTDSDLKLYSQQSASELFDQSYKKINPQEYGDLLSNLEKKYTDDLAGFEQAKGFLDSRMNLSYMPVQDLGSSAYYTWHEEHGITLTVLAQAAHFTIQSRTKADAESSLRDAVNFAREVLAKCGS